MIGLTVIVSVLFLVNYYLDVSDKVTLDYNPKLELVSLVDDVSYVTSDVVFDGMNLDELANKLEKSLNSNIKGMG